MAKALNTKLGKVFNYSNQDIVNGLNMGVLSLVEGEKYHFRDKQGEFFLKGKDAEKQILSKAQDVFLFDPKEVEADPSTRDEIYGTIAQGLEGVSAGVSDFVMTKMLDIHPNQLDFMKESAGVVGEVADIAGSVFSPINKFGKIAKGLAPASSIIRKEAIEGAVLGLSHSGLRSLSEELSHDRELTTDVLSNVVISTAFGGGAGVAIGGIGKVVNKFKGAVAKDLSKLDFRQFRPKTLRFDHVKRTESTPVGRGKLGAKASYNNHNEAWKIEDTEGIFYFNKELPSHIKTMNLDDVANLNDIGRKFKISDDLGEAFYASDKTLDDLAKKNLDDVIRREYKAKKELLKETIENPDALKEALKDLDIEMVKDRMTRMKNFNNYVDQFDAYKFGDQLFLTNTKAFTNDVFKKTAFMSEAKMSQEFAKQINKKTGVWKELKLKAEEMGMTPEELAKVNDMLEKIWIQEREKIGLVELGRYINDFPEKMSFLIKKVSERNNSDYMKVFLEQIEPILKEEGLNVTISSAKLSNYIRAKYLDKYLDAHGNPLPSYKNLYEDVNGFLSKIANYGKTEFTVDGVRRWKDIDLVTLKRWVEQAHAGGNSTMATLSNDMGKYGGELFMKELKSVLGKPNIKNKYGPSLVDVMEETYKENLLLGKVAKYFSEVVDKKAKETGISKYITKNIGGKILGTSIFGPLAGIPLAHYSGTIKNLYNDRLLSLGQKIASSANKFMTVHTPNKLIPAAYSLMDNDDYVSMDQEKISEIEQESGDFRYVENTNVSEFAEASEVVERMVQSRNNLAINIPKYVNQSDPFSKAIINEYDERRYLRYRSALLNPELTLERFANDQITYEEIDAIIDNYKGIHKLLIEAILSNKEALAALPEGKREIIKRILGSNANDIYTYQVKQDAMSSKNSQQMQKERLRKMNLNAQMNSMSKTSSLEKKNIE